MTATTAPPKADPQLDELCVNTIRTLAMDAVQKANSGHPGTPMALAPIAYVLYTRIMRHAPEHPDWPNRDRFVLSAGHASMLLYALLHLTGLRPLARRHQALPPADSPAAGHPSTATRPGSRRRPARSARASAMCTGLALGERMLNARLGDDVIDHHTFTIAGDGDMQEGISGEAGSLAGHLKLGRLIAFYDDNHISIEGDTALAFSEDVGKRYEAYGWHVQNLGEDLALDRIEQATRDAMAVEDRPSLIIVRTHIAPGSPHKQDTEAAHGSPLGEEEVRLTKQAYGWDPDKHVLRPRRGARALPRLDRARQRAVSTSGRQRSGGWSGFEMPEGWDDDVPTFSPRDVPTIATRKAGSEVLQVGGVEGAAPRRRLGRPRCPRRSRRSDAARSSPAPTTAASSTSASASTRWAPPSTASSCSGFRAFGSGFLIFSDYMKGVDPARLA